MENISINALNGTALFQLFNVSMKELLVTRMTLVHKNSGTREQKVWSFQ